MNRAASTLLAFALTPVFSTLILAWLLPVLDGSAPLYGLMPITWMIAAAATLTVGIPLLALLVRFDKVTWWSATLGGGLAGGVASMLLQAPTFSFARLLEPVPVCVGAVSGVFFWCVWRLGGSSSAG
jgi:hypothetical protein